MSPVIEVKGLTKHFFPQLVLGNVLQTLSRKKEPVVALNNISFEVGEGEIFGLIGPNGAGKTTLLKILASLILPSMGTVRVAGHDVMTGSVAVRQNIGIVSSEERSFYWRISGRKNLEFFGAFYNLSAKQVQKRIADLADALEVEEMDRVVGQYSSGMKQKLAVARSLLHDPPLLLMDEATKSLDPGNAKKIRHFVSQYLCAQGKKTVVWATHNLPEAETICSRIALITKGAFIAVGTMPELRLHAGVDSKASLEEVYDALSDSQ
jgi:ABC-2 type transport system ATP-binding protein